MICPENAGFWDEIRRVLDSARRHSFGHFRGRLFTREGFIDYVRAVLGDMIHPEDMPADIVEQITSPVASGGPF